MIDLKDLESQRKKYKELLDGLKKLEGEEKGILEEKERINKLTQELGYDSIMSVKRAIDDFETEIKTLTEKINSNL